MSNIIDSIQLSGVTYTISGQSSGGSPTVELTQAEYDALVSAGTVQEDTYYIITDSSIDYINSAQCQSQIDSSISGKVSTSDFNAYSGSVDTTLNSKASQSDLNSLSGTVTGHTANTTIHVTSSEKQAWNAKSDFSGSYNDLTDRPTIPTSASQLTNDSGYITSGDAQTQIDNSISGKVDTTTFNTYSGNVETSLSGKQDTLVSGTNIKTINNESILGSGNIDIQGGGKAVTAGTNISITTGETADTINCTLPIKTNAWNSLTFNTSRNPSQVLYASAFGDYTTASGKGSFAIGKDTTASGEYSFVGGYNSSQAKGHKSFSFGDGTVTNGNASVAFGQIVTTNNSCEFSCGKLNKSVTASTTFGDSGNTLFSVGNGTTNYHNAFEIRQNGDIYLTLDGQDVKLQDQLGGGGSSYSAGTGIDITNDVISVTGMVATSSIVTAVTSSSTDSEVPSAKCLYDAIGDIETLLSQI